MPRYQPADSLASPRFTGVRTFARLPCVQTTVDVDVAVIGLPFDTGATFRVGSRFAPEAVRSASVMLRPWNPELDVHVFQTLSIIDGGDAPVVPGFIEDSHKAITATLAPLVKAGIVTLGIGGDHSVALPELRALAAVHGPLALVQFDSHGDLWDSYYGGHKLTHGTPFRRAVEEKLIDPAHSVQLGMRGPLYGPEDLQMARELGFTVLTTTQLLSRGPAAIGNLVREVVGNQKAFLSFDIDFFDPSCAPGTGTPEVGGPTAFEGLAYLRACTGIHWVGGDVVEVLPAADHSQITAHLAAQVGYEFLSLVALARRKG